MAQFKIEEKELNLLHNLADLQHPHLKGNNHTRMLIDKVHKHEHLSIEEAFDCGKYYQRMLEQLGQFNDDKDLTGDYLRAVLSFKWQVK
jgi:hypothetical protein